MNNKQEQALKELSPMEAIRLISGIVRQDIEFMSTSLYLVCLIARNELGDADDEYTDEQLLQCGIKLIRPKNVIKEALDTLNKLPMPGEYDSYDLMNKARKILQGAVNGTM